MDLEIFTGSEERTRAVARALGELLRRGDVVALEGDLGAGKTVFAKGVAEGLGIPADRVNSPTFTIVTEHAGRIPLRHVDAYRLSSLREAEDIGLDEALSSPPGACVVEWAEKIAPLLPNSRLWVRFLILDGDGRRLLFTWDDGRRLRELQSRIRQFTSGGERKAMALIVQKYGGTSVGTIEKIKNCARRVARTKDQGNDVVVVVSAMSGETNRLLGLAHQLAELPNERELDVVASTGEQVTIGLLAIALTEMGYKSKSFCGFQIPILTDAAYVKARIRKIEGDTIRRALDEGYIVVVAGFQGIDETGAITTLGRGGSDTSAVAVAAALKADVCEIYTDVDGVYTTDPNICSDARKLDKISFEEMLELASLGAKVLQIRSVEFGMKYGVRIHVRSSFNDNPGTIVTKEEEIMETAVVSGVAYSKSEAKITLVKVPDRPGIAAKVFKALSEGNIVVDVIVQNVSVTGHTDLTFTVGRSDFKKAMVITEKMSKEIAAEKVVGDDKIAKVSIVGMAMRSHSGVATKMFEALAAEGINILGITTSEIKISCLIEEKYTELAVRVLHGAFNIGQAA